MRSGVDWLRLVLITVGVVLALAVAGFLIELPAVDSYLDPRTRGVANLEAVGVAVGAIATGAGALIAGAAAWVALIQLRHQKEITSWNALRDFAGTWNDLAAARQKLVRELRAGTFRSDLNDPNVNRLLNFMDALAFLANHETVSDELTWDYYFSDVDNLWPELLPYVRTRRQKENDPLLWAEVGPWLRRLRKIEERKRARPPRD